MKKTIVVLAALFYLALLYMPAKAQIPAAYQVGTWQNFKPAAVSYTFDDNCSNQIPVAIPLLNNYGFKSTIFAITQNLSPNWNNMKTAANAGHEIASHTVTHTNLPDQNVASQDTELKNSQATINTQITNQKCYTVAYPNCNIGDLATIQKYYIAGRTCSGQIINKSPTDFYTLSSIICGNTGVNTAADMNTRVGNAKSSGGWCVFLIHGIDNDGGYSPLASSVLGTHLSYVNTNTADYWVGTFGNVVKYIKERNALSIAETTVNADSLRMTPTDGLDNTIYSVAVTIRRQLPSTWTTVRVMQGTTIIASTIVTVSGVKYIQFDVVPDKGVYTLANASVTNPGCTTVAPTITSPVSYVQGATAAALTATGTALKWYGTNATGGTASTTAPTPATTTVGSTTYYVSQTLNSCEGPRAAIVVTVTASSGTGTTTSCGETGNGAYYTGVYRNMFKELLNKTDAEVNAKVEAAFQQLFYGNTSQQVYYPVGTDMAYILDVANNDVRTEGMSYGMMICVQLDKKAEFDKIWKWAKTKMQRSDGFFNWQLNSDGTVKGNGPASDGEAYFITSLLFASNRWGNGTGIYNYGAEAQDILKRVMSQGGNSNLFNANSKLITFVPSGDSYTYTDPSYNLPGFWELWKRWSTTNTAFWAQTPDAARKLLRDASNPTSGLYADYANFDGTPKTTSFNSDSHRFMYDAWRTIMNLGMDYHWFQSDAQQPVVAERYLTFFKNQGSGYKNHYDWNGTNAGGDHSTGLVACNAVASLAVANTTLTTPFVQEFWNVGIPNGTYRYYDGMLYMLAMLNCSGNFKVWKPACAGSGPVVTLTAPANAATYAAGANVTLTATATDADGTISKVEFYNGSTLLNSTTTSPYTYTWSSVAEGTYVITAVATDNSGNKTTSTAATITVGNPTTQLINNGEFDGGTTGWALQNNGGATGTMTGVTNGNLSGTNSLRICPSATPGTLEWHVQVSQTTPIVSGKTYTISFMAKADAARTMSVAIQELASPYTTYFYQTVNLTTTAQTFTFTYDATVTDASALIKFYAGADVNCVNIDKVSMTEGTFVLSSTITAGGATTFCSGGNVVLNANTGTGYTYQWNKDAVAIASATNASYTATQSGSYTVAVTANSQTVTSTATVVTVNTAPNVPTVNATVAYCQNAAATQLTATGTALKWYADNTTTTALASAPTPSTSATGTTNYFVSQTTNGCESARAQIAVTVN
uniref:glycosyl hydrolase family 8 n=1 Tax=Cytophaga aurantiaca TaxID=29530 RepID=UPI000687FCC2